MRRFRGCRSSALGALSLVLALILIPDAVLASNHTVETDVPTKAPVMAPVSSPPTAGPTRAPIASTPAPVSASPTKAPVPAPVSSPPTADPTSAPTPAPASASPTKTPVTVPVSSPPTAGPTRAPVTPSPTSNPTSRPTLAPRTTPTTFQPTASPTRAPTGVPSVDPTVAPTTNAPTRAPVNYPTTFDPTAEPTTSPTFAPTTNVPTRAPVDYPTTFDPTSSPVDKDQTDVLTAAPVPSGQGTTSAPTGTFGDAQTVRFAGMLMGLGGIAQELTGQANDVYEKEYTDYFLDWWAKNDKDTKVISFKITVTGSTVVSGGRRRNLQAVDTKKTDVEYTVTSDYKTAEGTTVQNDKDFINKPFNSIGKRNDFATLLRNSSETNFFADLTIVSPMTFPPPGEGSPDDTADSSNTTTIIIAVCASVGGLALIGGGYYLYSRNKKKKEGKALGDEGGGEDGEGKPPSQLQLSTLGGPDEVSTLAEPTPRIGVIAGGESLAGYGDQSVATVDYDYSKAYGGGGDSIVSETGGTLGSGTRGGGTATGESAAAGPSAVGASQSVFSDSSFTMGGSGVKEELIDIYAPPGKLGVVIDTPDDGPPVVHAIKDSSVIADQLKVGDKLVSVDDDDVRSMTAIKVSKIISRKSANPTRKLSVIRTSVG